MLRTSFRFLGGCEVGKPGPKGSFHAVELEDICNEITQSAITLSALDFDQVKSLLQSKLLEKRGYNQFADKERFAPIDDRTVRKYIVEMCSSEKKGKIKPISRIEPYLNIRNAISKAAGLTAISKVCPVENMHTEDKIGLFLFGWHDTRPKLVCSLEASKWLRTT